MKNSIRIKQHDITDCGAACLASVAAHYGFKLSISRIRQYASTDKKGTNLLGMVEAAEKMGFVAKGVKGDFGSLFQIAKPFIAHVIIKETLHHFVVAYGVSDQYVKVMDPADGKIHKYSHEEFKEMWSGVLILLMPGEGFSKENRKVPVWQRLWYLLKPHKFIMLQALVGAAVFTILGLSVSIYVQKIVDHVLVGGNKNLLNLLSIIMLCLLVLQIFIGVTKSVFTLKTGQLIDARLILGYYKHLLKLPQQFFDTMRIGEIISRINDAVKIRAFINDVMIDLIVNVFTVVFAFVLMFIYHWKLALVMLGVIPLYLLIYLITNRLNKGTQRKLMESAADLESQLVESLDSIYTLKSFGLESFANLRTETRFVKLLQHVYSSGKNAIFASSSSEFVSRLFTIVLLWVGSYFVIDQAITPGELLSFYALVGYFTGPVISLVEANKTIQDALIASDRLFELMDLEKEQDHQKVKLTKSQLGDIALKNVSFRYGSRAHVFEDLNITFPKGKVSAIVGESGSGKSTIAAILQKMYLVEQGHVSIGELGLEHIDVASLRQVISVVPQKIDLFAGNVIENIAVGEFNPDMERIIDVCKQLDILTFVENLPHGFNTYLGENGATLSGGQKQKVAIARALYNRPEVLVLDEATSALDATSESYVHRAIETLVQDRKTVIIIAHRLGTVRLADNIFVLESGKLVEQGNHDELLSKKGHYYHFWSQQFPILI